MKKAVEVTLVVCASTIIVTMLYWGFSVIEQHVEEEKYAAQEVKGGYGQFVIDGTNQAILIYFRMPDEVCAYQDPIVKRIAKVYRGQLKVVSVDCMYHTNNSSNIPFLTLFDVHHTPTFILRRKGEVDYSRVTGSFEFGQLVKFVDEGLTKSARK